MTDSWLDTTDLQELERLGKRLAAVCLPGDILLLEGDLGSGKTTLTQYIGKELGVADYITSPTFSLLHEYSGRLPLYHFDLYRLSGEEEIEDLGFLDYFYSEGISIIEWPDRLGSLMPEEKLTITLTLDYLGKRRAILDPGQGQWQKRISALLQDFCHKNKKSLKTI